MNIHQFQMRYVPEEDRVLFSILTTGETEFQLLLTRRFVKLATTVLQQLFVLEPSMTAEINLFDLEALKQTTLADQSAPKSSLQPLSLPDPTLENREDASFSDFTEQPQSAGNEDNYFGDDPVLIKQLKVIQSRQGTPILSFIGMNEMQLDINIGFDMVHSLYQLIVDTAEYAQWDIGIDAEGEIIPLDRSKLN